MDREQIESSLAGRELVLKYKQGGVIDHERNYRSGDHDPESARVIGMFLAMYARDKSTDAFELSRKIIGNGCMGVLPWNDPRHAIRSVIRADEIENQTEAARLRFEWAAPVRVSDVRESDGIVYVDLEAS